MNQTPKILRLEAQSNDTIVPANDNQPAILPVVAVNTMGVPISDMQNPDHPDWAYFKAPRPGIYRFSGAVCAQTNALGIIIRHNPQDRQFLSMTYQTPPDDAPRIHASIGPITVNVKAGDEWIMWIYNRGAQPAPVWFAESNYFEIEYLGESQRGN